jgi:hypothetical protein
LVSKTDTTAFISYSAPTVNNVVAYYDISAIPVSGGSSLYYTKISSTSWNLTGLVGGTRYNVNVYANNSYGKSAAATLNIITSIAAPDLSVNTIRGTSTIYTFLAKTNTTDSGIVTGNTFEYSNRTTRVKTTVSGVTSGSSITGLTASSIYDISLTIIYANTVSVTRGISFTTLSPPNAPSSLSVSSVGFDSVTLNVGAPTGMYTGYVIKTFQGSSFIKDTSSNDTVNSVVPITVNGLSVGTNYTFYAYSLLYDMSSALTSSVSTQLYSINPVTNLSVVSNTDTTVYISYIPSASPPIATSYDLSINPPISASGLIGYTDTSYNFTGLTQGTNYIIRVFAKNSGYSSVDASVNVYTYVSPISLTLTPYGTYIVPTFSAIPINDSGAISGNTIVYSKRGSGITSSISLSSGTFITGLDISSVYDMSLTVTYANTTSIPSGNSTTTLSIPPAMTSLDLSTNGITSVILSVTKPVGTYTGYTIRTYDISNSVYLTDVSYVDNTSGVVYLTISGLTADSSYSFYGYMNNYDLSSSISTALTTSVVRTYLRPDAVTNLSVVSKTNTTIYISYIPSASPPITTSYDLSINPPIAGSFTGYTDTSYNFTGLTQGTYYIIRVFAKNSGYSSVDASVNVYTYVSPIALTLTPYGRYVVPTFTASTSINDSGAISGNTILYTKRGSGITSSISLSSGTSITGLDISSVYDMSLTVTYANTTSIPSGNSTTTLSIPNPPSSIATGTITSSSIIITLGKPTGTLPFTGYTVKTYQGSTFIKDTSSNDNTSSSVNITVSGLTSSTTYTFNAFTYYSDLSSNTSLTTTATTSAPLYPSGLNTTGLRIYYNFEGNDNNVNRAGSGYNLTYSGATISTTTYKRGTQSLRIPATLQYASFSSSYTPTTNGLSFAFWFKGDNTIFGNIFTFLSIPNIYNYRSQILFTLNGGEIFLKLYPRDDTSQSKSARINISLTLSWYHIVWTLTYSNNFNSTWNLYINGQLKTTLSNCPYLDIIEYNNMKIAGDDFYGFIDEFYIFDKVLNNSDVNILYNI